MTDLPVHAASQANSEFEKLQNTDPVAAEYSISINYIELLLSLPWFNNTIDTLDLNRTKIILDNHHYGLDLVKSRVLEFLAAKTLKKQEKAKILIVDDEKIARDNLQKYFSNSGYTVDIAENGPHALEVIERSSSFDVLITDLKMDRMDGITLLEKVVAISPDTNVILVTGFGTVSSAVDALRKGATHYLTKPVKLKELKTTVEEVLRKQKRIDSDLGPVLCFSGPPGTGKTSIGRAISSSLGRQFIRLSMAGLRDEAELRGHRRTYAGAMPGRIITEIKRCGVSNPCILLDEIDKIGQDFKGDPASALLEILDPEQNSCFKDHYLDIPFNLSGVMFLTTVNDLDRLPSALLDRLELIKFPSYSFQEKIIIAKRYLLPTQFSANGLTDYSPEITDKAFTKIILDYTRESGVRDLNRKLGQICRKIALNILQDEKTPVPVIDEKTVTSLLGPRKYRKEAVEGENMVGVVTSLVWTAFGGEIMFIEALKMRGRNNLILTGSLGEVLRESARTALSFIRSNASALQIQEDFYETSDIHIHMPAGAVSKDGPSAGAAIAIALISLLTARPIHRLVAITGEMSLTGQILPVGGVREKLLAAIQAGCTKVLLPSKNHEDVETLSADLLENLEIIYIKKITQAIEHLLT